MRISLRTALLGSALALVALTPASSQDGASRVGAPVQTDSYSVLHDFAGPPGDGRFPMAGVTLDAAGNIYGTTNSGGVSGNGTIFELAPDGTETVLHSFGGADGASPQGAVVLLGTANTIYGTTEYGGSAHLGVLYRLTATGTYTKLHTFTGNDGANPTGRLIRDKAGNLYGTTILGGANGNYGTVFKYGVDKSFTVLHAFNGTDGSGPRAGVIRDTSGNLFGVTVSGGTNNFGTVFEIASDGTFSTLYNFTGGTDGSSPHGGLALDPATGDLFGSTYQGGANGHGSVFKLTAAGTLTTLYSFRGVVDGGGPEGDMVRIGPTLYSTASQGGAPPCRCGVFYQINAAGKIKVLHSFTKATGGYYSTGPVWVAKEQSFFGAASSFGAHNDGVVWTSKRS
jgi:uncharacterized repeat protein (TIGR03803 family)